MWSARFGELQVVHPLTEGERVIRDADFIGLGLVLAFEGGDTPFVGKFIQFGGLAIAGASFMVFVSDLDRKLEIHDSTPLEEN